MVLGKQQVCSHTHLLGGGSGVRQGHVGEGQDTEQRGAVDWSEAGVLSQGDNVGPALADCCQINLDLTLPHFF